MDKIFKLKIRSFEIAVDTELFFMRLGSRYEVMINYAKLTSLLMPAVAKVKQLQTPQKIN